jgi:hypothetical protein
METRERGEEKEKIMKELIERGSEYPIRTMWEI